MNFRDIADAPPKLAVGAAPIQTEATRIKALIEEHKLREATLLLQKVQQMCKKDYCALVAGEKGGIRQRETILEKEHQKLLPFESVAS